MERALRSRTLSSRVVPAVGAPVDEITPASNLLLSFPLEIVLLIIDQLTEHQGGEELLKGLHTKWALKRTCRFFWNLKWLYKPTDFFRRVHVGLRADRMKQWGLLLTFNGSVVESIHTLRPCYTCSRFLPKSSFPFSPAQMYWAPERANIFTAVLLDQELPALPKCFSCRRQESIISALPEVR
jgi:hypothetical protein